jgi:hypothetical protein
MPDDRPLHENRTIIILPWETDSPEWITDDDGNLLTITSTAQWFEVVKPQVVVSGLVGLDGEEQEEEILDVHALTDFSPKQMQGKSAAMTHIRTMCDENRKIAERLAGSRKLRQLLDTD